MKTKQSLILICGAGVIGRDYFEKLKAPMKGFYTFHQSAHSPVFEEPEKSLHIVKKDILKGMNSLAD